MNGRMLKRRELSMDLIDSLFELIHTNFRGVTRKQFQADLDDKQWVILIENDQGTVCGFSTLDYYVDQFDGKPVNVVYSGDTIVSPDTWGSSALSRTWINCVWSLHDQLGIGELYWLLITSGFRTYRFLPVFWKTFWPQFDRTISSNIQQWMKRLAKERFGHQYDPLTNIVRFDEPQILRSTLLEIPKAKLKDQHVQYFLKANPGYTQGDELVSLALLNPSNLTAAGKRMFLAGQSRKNQEVVSQ